LDHEKKAARLLLKGNKYLPPLQEDENKNPGYEISLISICKEVEKQEVVPEIFYCEMLVMRGIRK